MVSLVCNCFFLASFFFVYGNYKLDVHMASPPLAIDAGGSS